MNIESVKEIINKNLGRKVKITVYGIRNKINHYEGTLYKVYPNIFTILYQNEEKSFSFRDIITKDIDIKYI
jgi:uncharacterized protein Veg